MDKLNISDIGPPCLKEFIVYMSTIKGRSQNTIINYHNDIKLFFRYLIITNELVDKNTEFGDISVYDLDEYYIKNISLTTAMEFLYYMSAERKNSARARYRRAVSLRKFYKYLTDVKLWYSASPVEKLELPGAKASLPKYLTLEQSIKVLSSYNDISDIRSARDYCMLTFLLNCAMRLSELVSINVNDIKSNKDIMTGETIHSLKITGKGNKERIVYLNDACMSAYGLYMKYRNKLVEENKSMVHEKALFLSKKYRRISNRRVQQIIEQVLKDNNLDNMGFSVHKLRHTAATLMYQNGVDVRVLKEVLGHENLNTTQIYTHVANDQIKQAVEKNPLNLLKRE